MTIKAILAELKEAIEDLKAMERLGRTTDVREAKKIVQARLEAIAQSLSQGGLQFEEPQRKKAVN